MSDMNDLLNDDEYYVSGLNIEYDIDNIKRLDSDQLMQLLLNDECLNN